MLFLRTALAQRVSVIEVDSRTTNHFASIMNNE